jgi:hypothetical protein
LRAAQFPHLQFAFGVDLAQYSRAIFVRFGLYVIYARFPGA